MLWKAKDGMILRGGKTLEVTRASGERKSGIQERHLKWLIPSEEIDNNDAMGPESQNPAK